MKRLLLITVAIVLSPHLAHAQEITASPICFNLVNEAPYKVYGDLSTPYYTNDEGDKRRNVSTFRLEAAGTRHPTEDYLQDRAEFCARGPFYPGRQLEITLRALFPIFNCKTSIEFGDVIIKGTLNEDGTSKTWVECL